jgi:hypothetical protein
MLSRSTRIVLAGDTLALLAFVLVGMQTHSTLETPQAAGRFAVLAGPLLLTWYAASAALGALSPALLAARPVRWRAVWGRTLAAWLIAAPLALLLRALLLGSAVLVVPFMLVTLGLGGALLLGWRSLYLALAGRARSAP